MPDRSLAGQNKNSPRQRMLSWADPKPRDECNDSRG